jgi:hypothetical protein
VLSGLGPRSNAEAGIASQGTRAIVHRQTVEAILGSDLLAREQSVELFEVHAGKAVAGELAARLR